MTLNVTYDCDAAGCDAEELIEEFVRTVDLRLPSQREPLGYREPITAEIHFCDECFDDHPISIRDLDWLAVEHPSESENPPWVVGVKHRVRSGMRGGRHSTFDDRDSVVLSRSWEAFFSFVDGAIADAGPNFPYHQGGSR